MLASAFYTQTAFAEGYGEVELCRSEAMSMDEKTWMLREN